MRLHRNAKLGPAGRRDLVRAIERRATMRQAAAWFSVGPATAHRCSLTSTSATSRSNLTDRRRTVRSSASARP